VAGETAFGKNRLNIADEVDIRTAHWLADKKGHAGQLDDVNQT
jgi:hypothetical protein